MSNKKLVVINEKCPQNHKCPSVLICLVDALVQDGFNAPVVLEDKCIKCGKCVAFCKMKALVFEDVIG